MENPLERATKNLLKAALDAKKYADTLDPDTDGEVKDYYATQSYILQTLANEWDETTQEKPGTVVQFPGNAKVPPFPLDTSRRYRPIIDSDRI